MFEGSPTGGMSDRPSGLSLQCKNIQLSPSRFHREPVLTEMTHDPLRAAQ